MICIHCSSPATLKFTDKELCDRCFCKVVEKRVRKYVRINKLIAKDDRLLVIGDVCGYFVARIIKDLPVKIVKAKFDGELVEVFDDEKSNKSGNNKIKGMIKKNKVDKVIIPWTLDHECLLFMTKLFDKGFGRDKLKQDKKHIKLFLTIDEKSLIEFCRIKKLEYRPIKEHKLRAELDRLSEKYPEVKYSLGKSIEFLNKL